MNMILAVMALLVMVTIAHAESVTFAYDKLNRLVTATYADTVITYTYDGAGNMMQAVTTQRNSAITGVCGGDNGKVLDAAPQNLCLTGTPSALTGTGPWNWNCLGSGGGSTDGCTASLFAPTIDTKPPSYSNQATGTITFSANSAATFQCQLDNGSFVPCTSSFSYSNLTSGQHTVTIRATNSNGTTSTTSTTFTIVSNTAHSIAPASLNAGTLPVGATGVVQALVLSNTGASPLTISNIPAAAGDFQITHTCPVTLTMDANCLISTTFKPTSAGNRNATLTITDSSGPLVIALTGTGSITVSGMVSDPANVNNIVAGFDGAGIYRSNNGGTTWTPATLQPAYLRVTALAVKPAQFLKIYAASYGGGVFSSDDSGTTWSACANTGLTNLNILSLAIDSAGKLYAGSEEGVFSSANDCVDWIATNTGLPN